MKKVFLKGWNRLTKKEKSSAFLMLLLIVIASFSSALMVGAIFPFLSILADSGTIDKYEILSYTYKKLSFQDNKNFLIFIGIITIAVILIANLIQIINTWFLSLFVTKLGSNLSLRLFSKYIGENYERISSRNISRSDVSSLILSETEITVKQFYKPIVDFIASIFTVVAVITTLIIITPTITLITLSLILVYYGFVYYFFIRKLYFLGKIRFETNAERYRIVNDTLSGLKYIKFLGIEKIYLNRLVKRLHKLVSTDISLQLCSTIPHYLIQALMFCGIVVLCLLLIDNGDIANGEALKKIVPTLGLLAFAGQRLMPEVNKLHQAVTKFQYGITGIEKIPDFMLGKISDIPTYQNTYTEFKFKKHILFDNISFRYPASNEITLNKCCFKILYGETIGIVGASGSGKSTIANILLGLLTPTSGQLVIDDIEINNKNINQWKQNLSYVPQEVILTEPSIIENITLGEDFSKIDNIKLRSSINMAQINQKLIYRDDLYNIGMGDREANLSGGQIQRIGIARSLYKDSPILIMDESTSDLDNNIEKRLLQRVKKKYTNRTLILIAHRLHILKDCDKIIVIDKGMVSGFDTWENLYKSNNIFKNLVDND